MSQRRAAAAVAGARAAVPANAAARSPRVPRPAPAAVAATPAAAASAKAAAKKQPAAAAAAAEPAGAGAAPAVAAGGKVVLDVAFIVAQAAAQGPGVASVRDAYADSQSRVEISADVRAAVSAAMRNKRVTDNASAPEKMKELNLPNRGITAISADMSRCTALAKCDISGNGIKTVTGLSKCIALGALFVQNNLIGSAAADADGNVVLPTADDDGNADAATPLATTGLDMLPTALRVLNVSANRLTDRDLQPRDGRSVLGRLTALQAFIATHNALTRVPPGLSAALNSLVLSNNALTSLAGLPLKLPELTKLSISSNRVTDLTPSAALFQAGGSLNALCELRLNGNALTRLPDALSALTRLKLLDAGNNAIASFDAIACLKALPYLRNLNLKANPIAAEPTYSADVTAYFPMLDVLDSKRVKQKARASLWDKDTGKKLRHPNQMGRRTATGANTQPLGKRRRDTPGTGASDDDDAGDAAPVAAASAMNADGDATETQGGALLARKRANRHNALQHGAPARDGDANPQPRKRTRAGPPPPPLAAAPVVDDIGDDGAVDLNEFVRKHSAAAAPKPDANAAAPAAAAKGKSKPAAAPAAAAAAAAGAAAKPPSRAERRAAAAAAGAHRATANAGHSKSPNAKAQPQPPNGKAANKRGAPAAAAAAPAPAPEPAVATATPRVRDKTGVVSVTTVKPAKPAAAAAAPAAALLAVSDAGAGLGGGGGWD